MNIPVTVPYFPPPLTGLRILVSAQDLWQGGKIIINDGKVTSHYHVSCYVFSRKVVLCSRQLHQVVGVGPCEWSVEDICPGCAAAGKVGRRLWLTVLFAKFFGCLLTYVAKEVAMSLRKWPVETGCTDRRHR